MTPFIQSLYTGVTPNQTEVFIRLNPDAPLTLVASPPDAQNIVLTPGSASLIIDTVPEPGDAILLLAGTLTLLPLHTRRQGHGGVQL